MTYLKLKYATHSSWIKKRCQTPFILYFKVIRKASLNLMISQMWSHRDSVVTLASVIIIQRWIMMKVIVPMITIRWTGLFKFHPKCSFLRSNLLLKESVEKPHLRKTLKLHIILRQTKVSLTCKRTPLSWISSSRMAPDLSKLMIWWQKAYLLLNWVACNSPLQSQTAKLSYQIDSWRNTKKHRPKFYRG